MIELLSSRKMIVGVIILIIMCILIVILEGILTESELKPLPQRLPVSKGDSSFASLIGNSTEYCWLFEDYSVVEDCGPCTDFEKAAKHLPICEQTGFKKLVNCSKTGKVYISCAPSTAKKFWIFLLIMLSMSLLGALSVKSRIKYLERRMTERMQNKIDCGV
ncbi:protein JTB [Tetranychus urticae]|uniref:protein JTB n=1 Tax=Tetranychus urticae TaxID=32264 RepID=UPI00077C0DD4|nr:protein JTB [Tetranychus urticae]